MDYVLQYNILASDFIYTKGYWIVGNEKVELRSYFVFSMMEEIGTYVLFLYISMVKIV